MEKSIFRRQQMRMGAETKNSPPR